MPYLISKISVRPFTGAFGAAQNGPFPIDALYSYSRGWKWSRLLIKHIIKLHYDYYQNDRYHQTYNTSVNFHFICCLKKKTLAWIEGGYGVEKSVAASKRLMLLKSMLLKY